jgi:hypothetical protein
VSAVIYAAIVVMWAVVLVPMWLRRHDAATESRSVDRFSTAMRTLSRRTSGTPGRRYVVMPRRSDSGVSVHVSGAAVAEAGRRTAPVAPKARAPKPPRPVASKPQAQPRTAAGKPSIVARRRRFLLGLLALTGLTILLASAGVISWPLQIVFDVILVAFCVHLRAQAKRSVTLARQRRQAMIAAQLPTAAPRRSVPAAPMASRAVAEPVAEPAAQTAVQSYDDWAATGTDDGAADDWAADDDATWEPVPVPRPTYTMKPPAPAYEADPTYSPPVYERPVGSDEPTEEIVAVESDLDEILERRWAVND